MWEEGCAWFWHARLVEGSDRFRVCGSGRETVVHILAMCQPHQWILYEPMHDAVALCFQYSAARSLDLIVKMASFTVPGVVNGQYGKVPNTTANDGAVTRPSCVAISTETPIQYTAYMWRLRTTFGSTRGRKRSAQSTDGCKEILRRSIRGTEYSSYRP